jgi:hypothetical protein
LQRLGELLHAVVDDADVVARVGEGEGDGDAEAWGRAWTPARAARAPTRATGNDEIMVAVVVKMLDGSEENRAQLSYQSRTVL